MEPCETIEKQKYKIVQVPFQNVNIYIYLQYLKINHYLNSRPWNLKRLDMLIYANHFDFMMVQFQNNSEVAPQKKDFETVPATK